MPDRIADVWGLRRMIPMSAATARRTRINALRVSIEVRAVHSGE
jgi:hypothetical protein